MNGECFRDFREWKQFLSLLLCQSFRFQLAQQRAIRRAKLGWTATNEPQQFCLPLLQFRLGLARFA